MYDVTAVQYSHLNGSSYDRGLHLTYILLIIDMIADTSMNCKNLYYMQSETCRYNFELSQKLNFEYIHH